MDGTPVTAQKARRIMATHYTVPKEVRPRNYQRTRRMRREQHGGKKHKRDSHPDEIRGKPQTLSNSTGAAFPQLRVHTGGRAMRQQA